MLKCGSDPVRPIPTRLNFPRSLHTRLFAFAVHVLHFLTGLSQSGPLDMLDKSALMSAGMDTSALGMYGGRYDTSRLSTDSRRSSDSCYMGGITGNAHEYMPHCAPIDEYGGAMHGCAPLPFVIPGNPSRYRHSKAK